MAIGGVLEFCIYLDTFRNVDLYHQGVYSIKTNIHASNLGKKLYACPYSIENLSKTKELTAHYLQRPSLEDYAVRSKSFLVRYCEEEVDLKEVLLFRLSANSFFREDIVIELELLFNDLSGKISPEEALEQLTHNLELDSVSTVQFRLSFPSTLLATYHPFLFDDSHCCSVYSTIHSALLDFRYIPSPKPGSLTTAFFPIRNGKPRNCIGASETDTIYEKYMDTLLNSLDSLTSHLSNILKTKEMPTERERVSFSQRVASHDAWTISTQLMKELNQTGGEIVQYWHRLLVLVPDKLMMLILQDRFVEDRRLEASKQAISRIYKIRDGSIVQRIENFEEQANLIRRSLNVNDLPVIVDELFNIDSTYDLSLVSVPDSASDPELPYKGVHLFVLVHGFQGSSSDMRIFKNNISVRYPESLFLISTANEDNTEGPLEFMGARLAQEVIEFIHEWCPSGLLGRLSFIGHSLGGLIIRAALPHLLDFSGNMHTFLSLSSPHLGVARGSSKLIRAGIWLLKAIKKTPSLSEISLDDHLDIQDCFLYKMSLMPGLDCFKHVVLLSSPQDLYVPTYSARIETNDPNICEMARNLIGKRNSVRKISIDFKMEENSIDCWIGRAAHIQFLENHTFIKNLISYRPELFS